MHGSTDAEARGFNSQHVQFKGLQVEGEVKDSGEPIRQDGPYKTRFLASHKTFE